MVQEAKVLAAKADSLSSISGIYTKDHGLKLSLTSAHVYIVTTLNLELIRVFFSDLLFPRPSKLGLNTFIWDIQSQGIGRRSRGGEIMESKQGNCFKMANLEDVGMSTGCLASLLRGCSVRDMMPCNNLCMLDGEICCLPLSYLPFMFVSSQGSVLLAP